MTVAATAAQQLVRYQGVVEMSLTSMPDQDWETTRLSADDIDYLRRRGHFDCYSSELDWTPRIVAGHLRDSATIFASRVVGIRELDTPVLADFVTDDRVRIDSYLDPTRAELLTELQRAQRFLSVTLGGIPDDELERSGIHEAEGLITLRELCAFLPVHQRDHARQLALLATGDRLYEFVRG
jgi:hypothetical protein